MYMFTHMYKCMRNRKDRYSNKSSISEQKEDLETKHKIELLAAEPGDCVCVLCHRQILATQAAISSD